MVRVVLIFLFCLSVSGPVVRAEEKAERNLKRLIESYEKESDKAKKIDLALEIAEGYGDVDLSKSEEYVLQARDIAGEIGDKKRLAEALYLLFEKRELIGAVPDSESLDSACNLFKSLGDSVDYFQCLLSKSDYFMRTSQMDLVEAVFDSAEIIANKLNSKRLTADLNVRRADYFSKKGRLDQALELLDSAKKAYNENKPDRDLANLYLSYGLTYKTKGDYKESQRYYFKALDFYKKIDATYSEGVVFGFIGGLYMNMNETDLSIDYYEKSLEIARKVGSYRSEASVLSNLGSLVKEKGDIKKAVEYIERSSEVFLKLGNEIGYAGNLNNLSNIYTSQGKYTEAIDALKSALDVNQKLGLKDYETNNLINLAKNYILAGSPGEAIPFVEQAAAIAEEMDSKKKKLYAYYYLAYAYEKLEDYKKAYFYAGKYDVAKDSLTRYQNRRIIAEMEAKYELKEREAENKLLKKKQELKDQKIANSGRMIIGLIVMFVVVASFSTVVYFNRKKIKEQNSKLSAQNDELTELNATKDKFFSIIAHDLRNPISSFAMITETMDDQYDSFEDDEKKEIIGLIKTSSKNVQKLLENLLTWSRSQRGAIKSIPIKEKLRPAVEEAVSQLSAQAGNKKIRIENAISEETEVCFDPNLTTTIIRNIISNSIKYSEPGKKIVLSISNNTSETATIAIRDEGVGMDEKTVENLFNLTKSTSIPGTSGEEGSGLGLIICREFAEKQNGSIRAESELGKGSVFYLTLPKDPATASS